MEARKIFIRSLSFLVAATTGFIATHETIRKGRIYASYNTNPYITSGVGTPYKRPTDYLTAILPENSEDRLKKELSVKKKSKTPKNG